MNLPLVTAGCQLRTLYAEPVITRCGALDKNSISWMTL
jgi:hypothetical protein